MLLSLLANYSPEHSRAQLDDSILLFNDVLLLNMLIECLHYTFPCFSRARIFPRMKDGDNPFGFDDTIATLPHMDFYLEHVTEVSNRHCAGVLAMRRRGFYAFGQLRKKVSMFVVPSIRIEIFELLTSKGSYT